MRLSALFILLAALPAVQAKARAPICSSADGALHASSDACIAGHVYDVVTVAGGTRFLDLCSPDTPDESCHVSIVSYKQDRPEVGDLEAFRGKDISVRGALQVFDGRYVVVLNDQRQLHGGAARFTPDPRLMRGYAADGGEAENAPELKVNFHHRGKKLEKE